MDDDRVDGEGMLNMRAFRGLAAAALAAVVMVSGLVATAPPAEAAMSLKAVTRYTAVHLSWPSQGKGKTYQVQYSSSRGFGSSSSMTTRSTSTVVNHLSGGKTYYFRVRAQGGGWSTVATGRTSFPKTFGGYAVQKATKISTDNVSGSTIDLSWTTPSGQYACFRVSVSPNPSSGQPPTQCTTSYTIAGLKRTTVYTIKIYTVAPAGSSGGINWPAIDISSASSAIKRQTSDFVLGTPTGLKLVLPQRTSQATLSWTPPSPAPAASDAYQVVLGSDTAVTKNVRRYTTPSTNNSIVIDGLTPGTVYFARVAVVNASGAQQSDRSGYLLVKTLARYGTITGSVSSSAPAGSLVAVAYDSSGELDGQADVAANGTYSLSVPPGNHRIRIAYLGSDNYVSSWVSDSGAAQEVSSGGTVYAVNNETTTTVPTVSIGSGFVVSGSVVDGKTGAKVNGAIVSIQARNAAGAYETLRSMYSSGTYRVAGIVGGGTTYRLRVSLIGSATYKTTSLYRTFDSDTTQNLKLDRR